MKLTRKAHAKLNLFLEITGKRDDGYHELFSLVVFLDLADEITIEPAEAITVTQTNGDAGITDNIIYKTAEKLAKKYNIKSGAKISFTKNIPIGGGLGGGSSDAAVTLALLNTLWGLDLTHDEMYAIALELGADVPVCLYSILENRNAALIKGIGEIIEDAPEIPKLFFTLANPAIELSTAKVFAGFKYEGLGYEPWDEKEDFLKNIIMRSNDLEPAAIALAPEIGVALEELEAAKNCKLARMTGSGATSFGIFKTRRDARNAAVALIKKYPGWQIGPVGLKKTSAYKGAEKIKRPLLKTQVRVLKSLRDSLRNSKTLQSFSRLLQKLHVKTIIARNFGLSASIHLAVFILLGAFFIYQKYLPQTKYITVSFGIEKPAPAPVAENDYEPASGDGDENEDVQDMLDDLPPPVPKAVIKLKAAKKPVAHKAQAKKSSAVADAIGAANGNTPEPAKPAPKDYLELLQYTVQERSSVPTDRNLKGRAVLHLAFNREGYVLAYALKQKTGVPVLDNAAEKVAKNLMENPFPPVPSDFDIGDDVLEYDFVISYPHKVKS